IGARLLQRLTIDDTFFAFGDNLFWTLVQASPVSCVTCHELPVMNYQNIVLNCLYLVVATCYTRPSDNLSSTA
ncbi:MAG: hypothetical protein WBN61_10840, partial [Woeseiaceae bacterium]